MNPVPPVTSLTMTRRTLARQSRCPHRYDSAHGRHTATAARDASPHAPRLPGAAAELLRHTAERTWLRDAARRPGLWLRAAHGLSDHPAGDQPHVPVLGH